MQLYFAHFRLNIPAVAVKMQQKNNKNPSSLLFDYQLFKAKQMQNEMRKEKLLS